MGSGSSRASEDGCRGRRSRKLGVFSSSCFCLPFSLSDQQTGERHRRSKCITCKEEVSSKQGPESYESCREVTAHQCTKTTSLINTNLDQHVEVQCPVQVNDSDYSDSQGQSLIDQASNHSCCLHSPSSFLPEGPCFRTCRTSVVSSSGNYVPSGQDGSLDGRAGILENIRVENNHCDDRSNVSIEAAVNESSPSNIPETENVEIMSNCRRYGPHVPLEGSIQFSRTLSVGRLRDRVLRRNTLSKGLFGALLLEERSLIRSNSQDFSRQTVASQDFSRQTVASMSTSTQTNEALQASHAHGSTGSGQLHVSEASMIRDTSHHDLWEHRSAFLERRRRIRSQVRALQRLGRRFENLSGHDRSCILSGQHQTGHCTCRSSSGLPNLNNETSTNTSISRIVMLAEALFEALDEIHQQSAVLSSRQSISSIGSVPAPKEVVDSIPMKVYVKSKAHLNQEVPQCYICIVEYEDGDFIRTLPCQHEFHQICVDKWLKEIHRVCPMCRGNVCE